MEPARLCAPQAARQRPKPAPVEIVLTGPEPLEEIVDGLLMLLGPFPLAVAELAGPATPSQDDGRNAI